MASRRCPGIHIHFFGGSVGKHQGGSAGYLDTVTFPEPELVLSKRSWDEKRKRWSEKLGREIVPIEEIDPTNTHAKIMAQREKEEHIERDIDDTVRRFRQRPGGRAVARSRERIKAAQNHRGTSKEDYARRGSD